MKLRDVTPSDHLFVSILLQTAFEGPDQSRAVEQMRANGSMALELVAEDETTGQVVGHISFGRLVSPPGWWGLSPVAVVRDRQNSGIAAEILRYGLDRARQAKAQAVVVVGDPAYYARFGFSLKAAENILSPPARGRTLLYPIAPGAAGKFTQLAFPTVFDEVRPAAE